MCRLLSRQLFVFVIVISLAVAQTSAARAAECPATLSNFSEEGQTSDGATRVYAFDVHSADVNPIGIRVRALSASTSHADLTFPPFKLDSKILYQCCVRKWFGWSGPPLSQLQITEVTGGKASAASRCEVPPVMLETLSDSTTIRTYADPPTHAVPPVAAIEDDHSVIVDSDFVTKVSPRYPEFEKEQGLSGTVVVMIDVKPDGKAHNVRVADSSQSSNLDLAAAWAANHSTFKPPLLDGQPTSRTYKIEYVFTLDPGPPQTIDSHCGARLAYAWVDGMDGYSGTLLYNLGLASPTNRVSTVSIELKKKAGSSATVDAAPVHWVKSSDGRLFTAFLPIFDTLPISDAFILKATSEGGAPSVVCTQYPVLTWDNTDDGLGHTIFYEPTTVSPPKLVLPVRFNRETRPLYPAEAVAAREEGTAVLIIDVNPDGKPKTVRVFNSSKSWRLDDAATQSAWLSTFPPTGQAATYQADYEFRLHIPGVKYAAST